MNIIEVLINLAIMAMNIKDYITEGHKRYKNQYGEILYCRSYKNCVSIVRDEDISEEINGMTAFTLHQKKLDSEINAENDLNEKIKFLKLIE